jgi:uncharacterized membrane protein
MNPQEEKTWGMLAHVIPLAAYLTTSLGWVAALVIYLVYKDKSKFVAFHALQQLLMMGAVWIATILGAFLFVTVIGIPIAVLIWFGCAVGSIVLTIIAAIKANNGEWWEYPLVGAYARKTVG